MNPPSSTGADEARPAARPAPRWRRWLYGVGMALGLLLFGWQLAAALLNLRQSGAEIAAPAWLLPALGLAVAGYLLQLGGWLLVMRWLGCVLTPAGSFAGYFLSFLPRYVPGTVWGYLGRGEWLAQRHGVGYRVSSLGSLLEAGSFVATALAIGTVAYLREPWGWPAAGLLLAGAAAGWVVGTRLAGPNGAGRGARGVRAQHLDPRPDRTPRAPRVAARFWGGRWSLLPAALLVYLCYWAVQGLSLGAVSRALNITPPIDLLHLTAAAAMGWAAGFLTLFVPAGFGVRELSLTYLLTTQSGLPAAEANLLAVLSRLGLIVAELLMLAAALLWSRAAGGRGGQRLDPAANLPPMTPQQSNGPTAETNKP